MVFTVVLIGLAIAFEHPTNFQMFIFRFVASMVAGCAGVILTGFVEVRFGKWLRAGGAFALFVIVYFLNPAQLVEEQGADTMAGSHSIEKLRDH